jgi:hypothetical protein
MQDDAEALGLPSGEETEAGGMGDEAGGMEDDQVTLTMDRETAQKLHDLLGSVLGGGEEETEGEEFGGEEGEGEGESEEDEESSWSASEDSEEDEETEEEDSEEGEDEEEGSLKESPQAQYTKFETEGKAKTLQGKGNMVVGGAVASKVSGQGSPEKTAQTQGTAHYMPFKHKVDDAKGSQVVKSKMTKKSGEGDSIFQAS